VIDDIIRVVLFALLFCPEDGSKMFFGKVSVFLDRMTL
jgi:hypothetical protein